MTVLADPAESPYAWAPQYGPQMVAYFARKVIFELFFGGAVYGGKTDLLLGDFLQDIDQGSAWRGILFRKSFPELEAVIERSQELFPQTGGKWTEGKKTWTWPNGALLRMRSLDAEADYTKFQGHNYAWMGWDELPLHTTMNAYHKLKAWVRGPAENKRIRSSGNPCGRCHTEVKEYFGIDKWRDGLHPIYDEPTDTHRMFVPSKVKDNKIGLDKDPGYIKRLNGLGDPELVEALKEGDWDRVFGAYFSMFSRAACEVEPFEIPANWSLFLCLDWGTVNPTWAGLLSVDSDDDIYCVDEYYLGGEVAGADHARGVRAMIDNCPFTKGRTPRLNLAPHDMWTKRRDGEASQIVCGADSFAKEGLHLTRANMERVAGWRNVKTCLYDKAADGTKSRLKFFRGRTDHVCSSLSSVIRDDKNKEDVLKGGDDHPADGLRYGVNHVYKPRKIGPKPPEGVNTGHDVLARLQAMGQPEGRYA